jgi:hypothetical protein
VVTRGGRAGPARVKGGEWKGGRYGWRRPSSNTPRHVHTRSTRTAHPAQHRPLAPWPHAQAQHLASAEAASTEAGRGAALGHQLGECRARLAEAELRGDALAREAHERGEEVAVLRAVRAGLVLRGEVASPRGGGVGGAGARLGSPGRAAGAGDGGRQGSPPCGGSPGRYSPPRSGSLGCYGAPGAAPGSVRGAHSSSPPRTSAAAGLVESLRRNLEEAGVPVGPSPLLTPGRSPSPSPGLLYPLDLSAGLAGARGTTWASWAGEHARAFEDEAASPSPLHRAYSPSGDAAAAGPGLDRPRSRSAPRMHSTHVFHASPLSSPSLSPSPPRRGPEPLRGAAGRHPGPATAAATPAAAGAARPAAPAAAATPITASRRPARPWDSDDEDVDEDAKAAGDRDQHGRAGRQAWASGGHARAMAILRRQPGGATPSDGAVRAASGADGTAKGSGGGAGAGSSAAAVNARLDRLKQSYRSIKQGGKGNG